LLAWLAVAGCAEHRPAPARLDALSPTERLGYLREGRGLEPHRHDESRSRARSSGSRARRDHRLRLHAAREAAEGRMAKFLCRTSDGAVHKIKEAQITTHHCPEGSG
jgi:hypothetical protein